MTREYTEEYKKQALKLAREVGTWAAAKKLEMPKGTLDCWVHKEKTGQLNLIEKGEKDEKTVKIETELREAQTKIKEMEKEIAKIKKENEFLEEAASFFASSRQKLKQG